MARALAYLAPESLKLEIFEIGGLPICNQDSDDDPPTAYVEFRKRMQEFDGFLFITPEYNRLVPGVLKNVRSMSVPGLMGKACGMGNRAR
jgi:chromate reductase